MSIPPLFVPSVAYPRAGDRKTCGFRCVRREEYGSCRRRKEATMYISGGVLALVVVIALLIWLL
jgi:predicted nucleic acid-binding Zn ribbon protein